MSRPAVFLDRDGVINEASVRDGVPVPPDSPEAFRLIPGVEEACASFAAAGLLMVVVTNQPDIARGRVSADEVDVLHALLRARLPVDDVVVCPHDDADGCACRKPRPGMILDAARRWGVDLDRSVCVGDRWRDIEAGIRAGVHTVHVDWGHGEPLRSVPGAIFPSLLAARHHVLERTGCADGALASRSLGESDRDRPASREEPT